MSKREYIALPDEYLDEMSSLTNEEYGNLIRGLQRYKATGEEMTDFIGNEKHFWKRVMNREERYKSSFEKQDQRLKERAEKAAKARWEKEQKAHAYECLSIPKQCISIQTETETETETELFFMQKKDASFFDTFRSLWNKTCRKLPAVKKITEDRKNALLLLLDEYTVEDIKKVFEDVDKNRFLHGANNRGWKASFDWVIEKNHFLRLLEGGYEYANPKTMNDFEYSQEQRDTTEDEALFFANHKRKEVAQ